MKGDNTILIVVVILSVFLLFGGFGMMGFGGFGGYRGYGGMMNMMSGYYGNNFGISWVFSSIINILIMVVLILGIVWIVREIQTQGGKR